MLRFSCLLTLLVAVLSDRLLAADMVFSNQTASAQITAVNDPSSWLLLSQLDVSYYLGGGAIGDFNNDGYADILVLTGGGSVDELYINNGDGTFSEQAESWGVAYAHMGVGSAVGDYDNDGLVDIFVTSLGPAVAPTAPGHHLLYHNNGDGTFSNVADAAGVSTTSTQIANGFGAAFGDYDLDGDLDLMVVGWIPFSEGNRLFRNNGDGTFTDVTDAANLAQMNDCWGFSPRFVDMNGDGYPELIFTGDYQTSRYCINNGDGTFTDATAASGTGLDGNGMGHTVGDFDNDGRFDWYVTSVYTPVSYVGNVPGTGNMLYMNQGDHSFVESSITWNCNDGGWGWGTAAADFNHDGLLDIAETNGWHQLNGPQGPEWIDEPSYLFQNIGSNFVEVAGAAGIDHTGQGRGLATLDYDLDGDLDIVIFSNAEPLVLYRNDLSGADTHWLRVAVDTSNSPQLAPNGFGTRVSITIGTESQIRLIEGGSNYLVQNEWVAHFGVGGAEIIDELRLDFADGSVARSCHIPVDQTVVMQPLLTDLDGDGLVRIQDLLALLGAWGPCVDCPVDIDDDGEIGIFELLALLAEWTDC